MANRIQGITVEIGGNGAEGDHPQMSEEARIIIEEGVYTLPEIIDE